MIYKKYNLADVSKRNNASMYGRKFGSKFWKTSLVRVMYLRAGL